MKTKKKDYIWNSVAGIINAAEAVVMSIVVTRFGNLSDAGILSLAFAAGNVLMTVGKFGGRMFQVTDAKKQYTFCMYLTQRLLTIGLMAVSLMGYLIYGGYPDDKRNAIILIAVIYMIESLEDCLWGRFQSQKRLYLGAEMFSTRWIGILAVFISCMILTNDMSMALFTGCAISILVFLVWLAILRRKGKLCELNFKNSTNAQCIDEWLPELFRQTFPLFLAGFCSIFISNIPKFAIDRHMNDEVQACYGFVAMPVFVIGLLNQFIYQPTVVHLTEEYYEGKIYDFRCRVRKQMALVAGIMLACVLGAGLIGVPALSVIYHTNLSGYWKELVILQFAGGFLAISGYFTVLLTLMRKQKVILTGYVTALVVGVVLLNCAVQYGGTVGASMGYLFIMAMLFMFYLVSYLRIVLICKRDNKDG